MTTRLMIVISNNESANNSDNDINWNNFENIYKSNNSKCIDIKDDNVKRKYDGNNYSNDNDNGDTYLYFVILLQ